MEIKNKDTGVSWVDWCSEAIKNHPYTMSGARTQCELNKRWFHGDQYQVIDKHTGMIRRVNVKRDTKSQANFLQVLGKAFTAKMYSDSPHPQVEPAPSNTSYTRVQVCDVGNALLFYQWDKCGALIEAYKSSSDGYQTGWGILRVQLENGEPRLSLVDEYESKDIGLSDTTIYEKKITVIRCDPLNIYPDPLAVRQEDIRWVIYEYIADKKDMADLFGENPENIPSIMYRDNATGIEELLSSDNIDEYRDDKFELTYVREIYMKKCREYPNGAHIFVIGDRSWDAAEVEGMRGDVERMKYFFVAVNPNEDRLRGNGYVEMMLPAQRDSNKALSLRLEALRLAVPKWIKERNSDVSPITDGVDVVEYTNTGNTPAPAQSTISPLPQHLTGLPDVNMNLAKFITGMADPNLGIIPQRGSQTSGTVIRELKEATAQLHAPDILMHKRWLSAVAKEILILFQENYTQEEIEEIIGAEKADAIRAFMNADLVNGYGITIRIGEGFMYSAASRFEEFWKLAQLGPEYMTPSEFKQGMSNYFSMGSYLKEYTLDETTARIVLNKILNAKEAVELASMVELYFSEYDRHEIWVRVLLEFLRSSERFTILEKPLGPEKIEEIKRLLQMCQQSLAMAQMQQQGAMQPPMQGGMANPALSAQAEDNLHLATGQPVQGEGVMSNV
jgi:hypothetical protein